MSMRSHITWIPASEPPEKPHIWDEFLVLTEGGLQFASYRPDLVEVEGGTPWGSPIAWGNDIDNVTHWAPMPKRHEVVEDDGTGEDGLVLDGVPNQEHPYG